MVKQSRRFYEFLMSVAMIIEISSVKFSKSVQISPYIKRTTKRTKTIVDSFYQLNCLKLLRSMKDARKSKLFLTILSFNVSIRIFARGTEHSTVFWLWLRNCKNQRPDWGYCCCNKTSIDSFWQHPHDLLKSETFYLNKK